MAKVERLLRRQTVDEARKQANHGILLKAIIAAVVFLGGAGAWSVYAMTEYVEQHYERILRNLLDADVASLQLWRERKIEFVSMWAEEPSFQEPARALLAWHNKKQPTREELLAHDLQASLRHQLAWLLAPHDHTTYRIMTRGGLVLASSDDEVVGLMTNAKGMTFLAPMFEGKPFISRPFGRGELLLGRQTPPSGFRILAGQAIGAADDAAVPDLFLIVRLDPEADFTRILTRGRVGASGDQYAFDGDGRLLSESHFPIEDLRSLGILDANATTSIGMRVADPGLQLTPRNRLPADAAALPLTRAVALATDGLRGFDVDGYRDYRGVEVMGAWAWLDDFGFGVAVEVDYAEAYGGARPVFWTYGLLFAVLIIATVVVLVSYQRVLKLRRTVGQIERLGRYTLLNKIGEGGMGQVYAAKHAVLRRPTAIKLISTDRADEAAIKRFEREVQLTSTLTHPNTIAIYDYGVSESGVFYYAMEYLPGIDLAKLVEVEGTVPPARVVHILRQATSALAEAHGVGLIHRDIKPSNILICPRGGQEDVAKLLDFGLVKEIGGSDMSALTAPNIIGGTPGYISPERLQDSECMDPRTDIYALGVVAHNLLTGKLLFESTNALELSAITLRDDPKPPSAWVDGIPPELDRLIHACCARSPDDRPASADALVEAFDALDIPPWTQAQARAWWQAHGHLRPRPWSDRPSSVDPLAETVAKATQR